MNKYIYCVRGQVSRKGNTAYFKIVNDSALDLLRNTATGMNVCVPQTVFVLGPFLDNDEANDVELQASSLLTKYRGREDLLGVNPLEILEFRSWVDAQLLPILVHQKRARSKWSQPRIRFVHEPKVSAEQRAAVRRGTNKSEWSRS